MKRLIVALVLTHGAHTLHSPNRETKIQHRIRMSLIYGGYVARMIDFGATENCISQTFNTCHEKQLPNALVSNKIGFLAYELFIPTLEHRFSNKLAVKHPKEAIIGDSISTGATLVTGILTAERKY